uniref:Uncharacterized protein n=1 Tax=Panagrolaimus superbus TaxID=310955 RepID=A0A914YI55_9BILA
MRPRLRPKPKIWYEKFVGCTFYQAGGFGNQIWRLASLYGIGKTLGRQPYIENRVLLNDFINATWKRMNLTEIGFVFPLMYSTLNIMNPPNNLTKIANFAKDCCKYDEPKK